MGIRLEGDIRKLLSKLKQLGSIDRKHINADIAEMIRSSTRQRFRTQKGPDGKRWVPSKRAQLEGGLTLSDTARLKNSIRARADSDGFAVGTNTIYAATHQFGEKGRTIRASGPKGLRFQINGQWVNVKAVRVRIPARPFIGLSADDQDELKAILEAELKKEG